MRENKIMRRKITKETNPASEYDSQRETRVLLEDMNKGIKIIAEQHGDVVKRLDSIDSEIGLIKSDVGSIKLEVMEVDNKLTINISRNDERFRKIEEKLCLN